MHKKIAEWIAGHPKTILIAATLLLIPAALGYFNTFVNYDIMSYLPADMESVQGEQILDDAFGCAANVFLTVENMPAGDVAAIKKELAAADGVSRVIWANDIADITVPASMLPDAVRNIFYSENQSATLLVVQFREGAASETTMNAVRHIKALLNRRCTLSGMSVMMQEMKELAKRETPVYAAVAVICALAALSLTADSFVLPFVLLIAPGYAVIYNMGTNFWIPGGISYITQCVAAVLQLGVTMDYAVFLSDRYHEELRHNPNPVQAMAAAMIAAFRSLWGSSLTTVFGFLALCFMSFSMGLDIGLVMAKGVVLGVVTVMTVLPAFLLLLHKPLRKLKHRPLLPHFSGLNRFVIRHRKGLAAVFALLLIPAFLLKSSVKLNYSVTDAMPGQLASSQSLKKLKEDFNMTGIHFVLIRDSVPAARVSAMAEQMAGVEGVGDVISLQSLVGPAVSESMVPENIRNICVRNGYRLMAVTSRCSASSQEGKAQIEALRQIVKHCDPGGYLTGEGAMNRDLVTVTDKDFKVTGILSVAAVFLLIAIAFRSAAVPVLLVLAVELAIMINEGLPALTGAVVSFIAPTVIGCVQLGATVDYAILLTVRYREGLQKGADTLAAMQMAADAADCSVFRSALVFFGATFGVYAVCSMEMVSSLCAMLARGAVISALVVMIFLPALLTVGEKIIEKCSYRWKKNASALPREE